MKEFKVTTANHLVRVYDADAYSIGGAGELTLKVKQDKEVAPGTPMPRTPYTYRSLITFGPGQWRSIEENVVNNRPPHISMGGGHGTGGAASSTGHGGSGGGYQVIRPPAEDPVGVAMHQMADREQRLMEQNYQTSSINKSIILTSNRNGMRMELDPVGVDRISEALVVLIQASEYNRLPESTRLTIQRFFKLREALGEG